MASFSRSTLVAATLAISACLYPFDDALLARDGGAERDGGIDGGSIDAGTSKLSLIGSLAVRAGASAPSFIPPFGTQPGDLLIVLWTTSPATAVPAGFTESRHVHFGTGPDADTSLSFRVLDGGEATARFTFPGGMRGALEGLFAVVVRGAEPNNPIDQSQAYASSTDADGGDVAIHRTPELTTGNRASIAFAFLTTPTEAVPFPQAFPDAGLTLLRSSGSMVLYVSEPLPPRSTVPPVTIAVPGVRNIPGIQLSGVGAFNVTE